MWMERWTDGGTQRHPGWMGLVGSTHREDTGGTPRVDGGDIWMHRVDGVG